MKPLLLLPAFWTLFSLAATVSAAPQTLVQLGGGQPRASRLSESVVVIIDAQREYLPSGRVPLAGIDAALSEIDRLLQRARAAHVPIIHIQHLSPADSRLFAAGSPGAEFAPGAQPLAGETVIPKQRPSAFAGTTLAESLQRLGRRELILAGAMTHMCVSTTARAAIDHGYHVTVVANACATRDLPDLRGATAPAETVHRVALAELADRFATVVASTTDLPN
ncbi:cysteine hydrolase family protein [Opitutus sp. ER46]|uniref:cysteine hydrolase family protein n=1 Tax=Opitutus sp. ER46 TaxID=2161864 RepID=UPI000D31CBEB|nr:cysteine hydrolase family protein [Opitutus sp. ER46]PTX92697.1 cysteine hydrolase [Opitutus sp. ER46]